MLLYDQTRIAWPLIIGLLVVELVVIFCVLIEPSTKTFWVVAAVVPLILINFYRQRVSIDDQHLAIVYGIGLLARFFELRSISSVGLISNPSVLAWCLHPGVREVVQIHSEDQRSAVFESDRPQAVIELIRARSG